MEIPYWRYERFDLEKYGNDECLANFRFYKNDLYDVADALNLPRNGLVCSNGTKAFSMDALCLFLRRHCYPCRYVDLVPLFGRSIPELCLINNTFVDFMYDRWGHLLTTLNQPWLSPINLQQFANVIHEKGAALENCWGFVDGTVAQVCRPGLMQRILYNGHKRVHAIKYHSVTAPNGLCANLRGPYEGKLHDASMLRESGQQLQQHCMGPNGNILCIYRDPSYPVRPQLMGLFSGNVTADQKDWNKSMRSVSLSRMDFWRH